ncbi:TPA: hypothetical protein ACRNYL_001159 [Pseudomonas aeruginosa]
MIKNDSQAPSCTCPSGDGSLVHPCPAHPAVEQAGGDERVIGWRERILAAHPNSDPGFWTDALLVEHMAAEIADLRAALAQPSPAQAEQAEGAHVPDEVFAGVFAEWWEEEGQYCRAGGGDYERTFAFQAWRHLYPLLLQDRAALAQPSPAQAEAERPEVAEVAFVLRNIGAMDAEDIDGDNVDLRFEDAEGRDTGCDVSIVEYAEKAADLFEQHDRIVGALRADRDSWAEQAGQRLAELERQEPVAWGAFHFGGKRDGKLYTHSETEAQIEAYILDMHRSSDSLTLRKGPLYAGPVAQAQQLHNLDKQCRDDVARALGLRPNQERGFAWSYLLASIKSCVKASGDSAQAQHSGPEEFSFEYRHPNGESHTVTVSRDQVINEMPDFLFEALCSKFCNCEPVGETNVVECSCDEYAEEFKLLAAAPGNSVPQAWLDVQAERRRQITAEGWTPEHDDEHADGQMAQAAGCYALHAGGIGTDWPDGRQNGAALFWPWDKDSWKPTTPRRDLVKACALALAEIERLDRATATQGGPRDA